MAIINGTPDDDTLIGTSDPDTLNGLGGNDTLRGGAGGDILSGGDGSDTADYQGSSAEVFISLPGNLFFGGDATGDQLSSIENVIGSSFDDSLAGGAGSNIFRGGDGRDLLQAYAGDDSLFGDAGDDTVDGGNGSDQLFGGAGKDLMFGDDGVDLLDDGADSIDGGADDDEIWGHGGNDTLVGGTGNDVIKGNEDNDVLRGGAGADKLDGGTGSDTASYYTSGTGMLVSLATGLGSGGEAQGDTLTGIENVSGSQAGDSLYGNADANVLQGWNGNDVLVGRAGKDTLTGGAGADRFVYVATTESMVGANADRIADFSHAQGDRVDLAGIDANTTVGGDQAFSFIGSGLYTGVAGQLRFAVAGGVTTVAGDVNGDGVSDFHIQLTGAIGLVAGDFVL
ncbi:calcium-binding protein [Mycobacterium sp. KBS0706]|uniref:calcium-binding protein n=1 Tax=Mycobacterium sp. KBS0706 TaxID=2578109 RepID=UPI00163D449C|nr:calcium-binding protein [Mycobacterium sp. KBS0706]